MFGITGNRSIFAPGHEVFGTAQCAKGALGLWPRVSEGRGKGVRKMAEEERGGRGG